MADIHQPRVLLQCSQLLLPTGVRDGPTDVRDTQIAGAAFSLPLFPDRNLSGDREFEFRYQFPSGRYPEPGIRVAIALP